MKNTFCIDEHKSIDSLDYIYQARKNIDTINQLLNKGFTDQPILKNYKRIDNDTRTISRYGSRKSA